MQSTSENICAVGRFRLAALKEPVKLSDSIPSANTVGLFMSRASWSGQDAGSDIGPKRQKRKPPPPFLIASIFFMFVPIVIMFIWWLYGLWAAFRCWQGRDFKYILIGRFTSAVMKERD